MKSAIFLSSILEDIDVQNEPITIKNQYIFHLFTAPPQRLTNVPPALVDKEYLDVLPDGSVRHMLDGRLAYIIFIYI